MKIITLLICTMLLTNCGTSKQGNERSKLVSKTPFTISSASSQKWAAGAKEGGTGTNVSIEVTNLPQGITFQEIHYGGMISDAQLITKGNTQLIMGYFKNDMKQDVIMDSDPLKEAQNTLQGRSEYVLENNQAFLIYTLNGKQERFKIEEMDEKPMIAYPSANPHLDGMGIGN